MIFLRITAVRKRQIGTMRKNIAVIGGGACGMAAAISAAREGACVTIYERNDRLGKKILATGNGKCNLGNLSLSIEDYHSDNPSLVARCLERFGTRETEAFFHSLGLMIKEKNGYLYPKSEQASSVLDVLRMAVERYGVRVVYEAKVNSLKRKKDGGFELGWEVEASASKSPGQKEVFDHVILACGSKAAPKTGSDGSGYQLAKQMGLTVTEVVPALVQLHCREDYCKSIAGVRAEAKIHIRDGRQCVVSEQGELQLTEYGISGIPVFQLSGQVNQLLKEQKGKELIAEIDFLPEFSKDEWNQFVEERMGEIPRRNCETAESFFTGMLHKKLMLLFMKLAGLKTNTLVKDAGKEQLLTVFRLCREFTLHITGSHSYDHAQICAGGVSMKEVSASLEALKVPGLYLAGELLHVDGRCGGYNLQWAWTSGCLAGRAAAGKDKKK